MSEQPLDIKADGQIGVPDEAAMARIMALGEEVAAGEKALKALTEVSDAARAAEREQRLKLTAAQEALKHAKAFRPEGHVGVAVTLSIPLWRGVNAGSYHKDFRGGWLTQNPFRRGAVWAITDGYFMALSVAGDAPPQKDRILSRDVLKAMSRYGGSVVVWPDNVEIKVGGEKMDALPGVEEGDFSYMSKAMENMTATGVSINCNPSTLLRALQAIVTDPSEQGAMTISTHSGNRLVLQTRQAWVVMTGLRDDGVITSEVKAG